MYHYVRDSAATPFPGIRALAPALFERQLDWLQDEHTPIDLATLTAAIDGRRELPPRAALLTFDDGFTDHFETVFPALRRRGLSGTFFVAENACLRHELLNVHKTHFLLARLGADAFGHEVQAEGARLAESPRTAAVFGLDQWEHADERRIKHLLNYELPVPDATRVLDRLFRHHLGSPEAFARGLYLQPEMIRLMAAEGMTFGYHTRSHRMLSRLSTAEQEDELRPGPAWIRALTGQADVPFCYPWGGRETYTAETVRLLAELGYSVAFNTVRRQVDTSADGRYEVPRLDTRDLPPHTSSDEAAAVAAAEGEGA
jgi:peptidoglycan/xylan/chitin deacetylase (PgdA/CDA1 family)